MDYEPLAKLCVNYGLGIFLSIGMASFLMWLLKYVLKQNEVRETRLGEIISKDIALVDNRIKAHDEKTALAIIAISEHNREARIVYENIRQENERRRIAQEEIVKALTQINISLSNMNIMMLNSTKNGK